MVVIAGCVVVIGAVLVGFTMAGGTVAALVHVSEIVTIGGASLGALIVMSSKRVLRDLVRSMMQTVKGTPFDKAMYADLFKVLYALARVVRREGLIALEGHVTNPGQSAIFKKYPRLAQNHHVQDFLCDALALLVDGKAEKAQITAWLEEEVKVIEREHHAAVAVLTKTADGLPGFGIVAAVLGIVVTMQAIGGPVEEIGHKVGAALVGTFLGILLSDGFFAPMAGRMELLGEEEATFFRAISAAVVAISEGTSPKDVVLCVRRSIGTDCRPSQAELNQIFKEGDAA
ncbi:MAG: flagellar motor stator protein MotA [Gemmataceae bacterium]|nr:flagellar motor stator protein MotA [Gemmataceae bacterium]